MTDILKHFKGVVSVKGRAGRHWRAHCPAHDDKQPSLQIDYKADRWLLICRAGCKMRTSSRPPA